jgi:hypothetical protein
MGQSPFKGLALFYSEPVPRLAFFLHSELLRGGVGAPIKQMLRYLSLGAAGEVKRLSKPEQVSDLPRCADYLR